MSTSPDYAQVVDLVIYDKDATDFVNTARTMLQSRIPQWVPQSTNQEMLVIEAVALEMQEAVFSLNRLPSTMLRVLLKMYGVEKYAGNPPQVTVQFTMYDNFGHIVPADTEIAIQLTDGSYLSFYTVDTLSVGSGETSGTIVARAREYTKKANNIDAGAPFALVDAVVGVESVISIDAISDGTEPEDDDAWIARGVQVLRRLVNTLVLPQHFIDAALLLPFVYRANAVDNYDVTAGGTIGGDPGHVTVFVYGIDGPLSPDARVSIRDNLQMQAQVNLAIHVANANVVSANVTATIKVKPGYIDVVVKEAVEAALTKYLNTNTWVFGAALRPYEIVSVIDNVEGVDYVDTLTSPSSVTPGDPATLFTAGTISITTI